MSLLFLALVKRLRAADKQVSSSVSHFTYYQLVSLTDAATPTTHIAFQSATRLPLNRIKESFIAADSEWEGLSFRNQLSYDNNNSIGIIPKLIFLLTQLKNQ